MMLGDFRSKLKKLNPTLWVDTDRRANPYQYDDYPCAGLYSGTKFITATPHIHVPEYSWAAINFINTPREELDQVLKTGMLPEDGHLPFRLLWRGWRVIVSSLIQQGLVNREQAEKEFRFKYYEKRTEFPKHFIHKEF